MLKGPQIELKPMHESLHLELLWRSLFHLFAPTMHQAVQHFEGWDIQIELFKESIQGLSGRRHLQFVIFSDSLADHTLNGYCAPSQRVTTSIHSSTLLLSTRLNAEEELSRIELCFIIVFGA